uniref:UTP14C small subunit processome component n=1 Tax=Cynoglossus semilaevis TaxID=244447 RepID=A0A3P8VGC0_CYNSE
DKQRTRRSINRIVVLTNADDEEELMEDLNVDDGSVDSGTEEPDCDGSERKRLKLLEAISALGGKKKRRIGERSEAAVNMSEFTVNAEGEGDKIQLSDLIQSANETQTVPLKTRKQLKHLQQQHNTLDSPLSKQETQRIQRDVAFQKTAAEVSRWKGVISQNRQAEQLVFPLNQESAGPKPMERVVTSWRAETPLEQQVFALLSANKQPTLDPVLTPVEKLSQRAISLEEAKIRRAELQKARALQSYYEAKAHRERKIKSKKYHRVQNKAKRKEFVKQFDQMVKTDPAAALEELNKIEVARMQERMSLKHQNRGKWAKSKAIMAKYDKDARKAVQQQLEVNKDLTQKLVRSLNDEEEEEEEEAAVGEPELMPDFVNQAESGLDSSNPWMKAQLPEAYAERLEEESVGVTPEKAEMEVNKAEEEEEEEEEDNREEEEVLLSQFEQRRKLSRLQEADVKLVPQVENQEEEDAAQESSDHEEEVEEEEEEVVEEQLAHFTSLFQAITKNSQDDGAERAAPVQMEEGLVRIRTVEDVELLTEDLVAADQPPQSDPAPPAENPPSTAAAAGKSRKNRRGIELTEVLTKDTVDIDVPLGPTVTETEDTSEEVKGQRGLISEAFAGDDVVADFIKDKRKHEDEGKPKVVDLTLPGWGEWGGTDLKPSTRKRRRFRLRSVPPPPRKDQHLPSVIISDKRNSSITLHQVESLPFPFTNPSQFESTIGAPVGRTWNSEQVVRKVTKPKVVTRLGTIIEPMTQEELMKGKQ